MKIRSISLVKATENRMHDVAHKIVKKEEDDGGGEGEEDEGRR